MSRSSLLSPGGLVGIASLSLAIVILLVPASSPAVAAALAALTGYWYLIAPLVAIGLALGVRTIVRRDNDESSTVDLAKLLYSDPDVEEPPSEEVPSVRIPEHGVVDDPTHTASTPGERVDDLVDRVDGQEPGAVGVLSDRNRIRNRVREIALAVLTRQGYDAETATEMLDRGTWTGRPRAAAFLGEETVERPLRIRIADWASGRSFERTVRVTVDAIAAVEGVDPDDEPTLPGYEAVDRWLGTDSVGAERARTERPVDRPDDVVDRDEGPRLPSRVDGSQPPPTTDAGFAGGDLDPETGNGRADRSTEVDRQ